jgi:hypothetical protein
MGSPIVRRVFVSQSRAVRDRTDPPRKALPYGRKSIRETPEIFGKSSPSGLRVTVSQSRDKVHFASELNVVSVPKQRFAVEVQLQLADVPPIRGPGGLALPCSRIEQDDLHFAVLKSRQSERRFVG